MSGSKRGNWGVRGQSVGRKMWKGMMQSKRTGFYFHSSTFHFSNIIKMQYKRTYVCNFILVVFVTSCVVPVIDSPGSLASDADLRTSQTKYLLLAFKLIDLWCHYVHEFFDRLSRGIKCQNVIAFSFRVWTLLFCWVTGIFPLSWPDWQRGYI